MPKFRNVSPYGDLELPLVRRVVAAGEVFEVTPEQAKHLAGQDENFEPVHEAKDSKKPDVKKPEGAEQR
jgi:hypothetical protein